MLPLSPLCDQDGTTPVYIAAQNGHVEALELLWTHGADVNKAKQASTTSNLIISPTLLRFKITLIRHLLKRQACHFQEFASEHLDVAVQWNLIGFCPLFRMALRLS